MSIFSKLLALACLALAAFNLSLSPALAQEKPLAPSAPPNAGSSEPQDLVTKLRSHCEKGDAKRCLLLGVLYSKGMLENLELASVYLQKACDGNEVRACGLLAYNYEEGKGVKKNHAKAARLYQKACDGNELVSCLFLGAKYDLGQGVKKDRKKAVSLYQKACDGDEIEGCMYLAYKYREGKGVEKNLAESVRLYQRACDLGDAEACRTVDKVNEMLEKQKKQ